MITCLAARQAADTIAQWEAALQIDLYEFQVRS